MATRQSRPWYDDEEYGYSGAEKAWIREYYPMPARLVSRKDALDHSLRKWIGLRKKNLKKFGLANPPIGISEVDCALCNHYIQNEFTCDRCPLVEAGNGLKCCELSSGKKLSPFHAYRYNGNPEPMIRLIRKAIKARDAKKAAKK